MTNIQLLTIKAVTMVAAIGGLWWANQHYVVKPAVDRANASWQQRWGARDKADAQAALNQEKANREKEQTLQAAADAAQRRADADRDALARRLADQRAVADRLQQGVQAAIDALNNGATVAGPAASSATRPAAGVLLAELYRSVSQRAADLAGEADRARYAGLTCEKLYNNARLSAQEKAR